MIEYILVPNTVARILQGMGRISMTISKASYSWLGSFKVTGGKGSVAIHLTNITSHCAVSPVLPIQHVSMQSHAYTCIIVKLQAI